MIPFNKPPFIGNEQQYVLESMQSAKISGDGMFSQKCHAWFKGDLGCKQVLLTPSCTAALEMTALLIDIQAGDEVIMPSYTFVSSANAFVLRGAKIVFVDIRPDTMNIDESLIEAAITPRTKAIVPVHYAGVACEMDEIMRIAKQYSLYVVEDAAQAMMSSYKGKKLGTIGHFGAFSFHETKNYTSGGEGGLLIVNDEAFIEKAEIIREKGTNRSEFFRGIVDKYTWVGVGSSYLLSDLQAAYLWGQLEQAVLIKQNRLDSWQSYYDGLLDLAKNNLIELPEIPIDCQHNGHLFYIKVENIEKRQQLIEYLYANDISAVFHYVPLHSSPAGREYADFCGKDIWTTKESERLLRLPLWYGLSSDSVQTILGTIIKFFTKKDL